MEVPIGVYILTGKFPKKNYIEFRSRIYKNSEFKQILEELVTNQDFDFKLVIKKPQLLTYQINKLLGDDKDGKSRLSH